MTLLLQKLYKFACATILGSHNIQYCKLTKLTSPAYETAVDPWSNTIAMEIPSTYSPSLVKKSFSDEFLISGPMVSKLKIHSRKIFEQTKVCM